MPKATLTYDLYEERSEFLDAVHGVAYAAVLSDLDNWLRGEAKYHDRIAVPVDEVRAKLRELAEGLPWDQ